MSARERLEQIKREREERLRLKAQPAAISLHPVNKAVGTSMPTAIPPGRQKQGINKKHFKESAGASGNRRDAEKITFPTPMAVAPPLSLQDLSASGPGNEMSGGGSRGVESVLSSYWDRHGTSFDNCNSYTNISYDEHGEVMNYAPQTPYGQAPSRDSFSTISTQLEHPYTNNGDDVVAGYRQKSEAALRASVDQSVALNIRRLNSFNGNDTLRKSNIYFNNSPRSRVKSASLGFDDDGMIEPDDDSSGVSVSRYSTTNNVPTRAARGVIAPPKVVQTKNAPSRSAKISPIVANAKGFWKKDNETSASHLNSNGNHNDNTSNSEDGESLTAAQQTTVEQRLEALEVIWRSISEKRIANFVSQYKCFL